MKPLRTSLLILGATALVSTACYFATTRGTAPSVQVAAVQPAPQQTSIQQTAVTSTQVVLQVSNKPAAPSGAKAAVVAKARTPKRSVQNPANIPAQAFTVKADHDTVFTTAGGCTLQVPAHVFVDVNGHPVKGAVTVAVKEVLKPVDYVLGNMMTLYEGKPLESGGTFCITASARGEELALADGAALSMAVPSRSKKNGMKFFPGQEMADGVVWNAPLEMEVPQPPRGEAMVSQEVSKGGTTKKTNLSYWVEGFVNPSDAPPEVHAAVNRIAWEGDGLWLTQDTSFMVGKHRVLCYTNEGETARWDGAFPFFDGSRYVPEPGTNTFNVDHKTNYVFQVKQLGWANIDRLLYDKRTRPVDMITNVTNTDGMKDLCITLVMKSHGVYLPGYQCKDGSYGFSHGDFEKMQLPIGAKATVLCTAMKDGRPWYALQDIIIAEKGTVDLTLSATTNEALRGKLMAAL